MKTTTVYEEIIERAKEMADHTDGGGSSRYHDGS